MADTGAPKAKASGPKTLDILIHALKDLDERKGVTIPAIKNYMLTNYPDRDPLKVKSSLKKAIEKGFDDELLVRPKSSEAAGICALYCYSFFSNLWNFTGMLVL